jgi:hypothetical protein
MPSFLFQCLDPHLGQLRGIRGLPSFVFGVHDSPHRLQVSFFGDGVFQDLELHFGQLNGSPFILEIQGRRFPWPHLLQTSVLPIGANLPPG